MKTHTIRPTQTQFGFIVDDEIILSPGNAFAIHLNKGPKKPEDYKDYLIAGRSFQDVDPSEVMCNEHLYIDVEFSDNHEPYIRGFIANFLESDLDNIKYNSTSAHGVFSNSSTCYINQSTTSKHIEKYLKTIFGCYWFHMFPSKMKEYHGVQLFKKRIYLDSYDNTFGIDLSDIPLKDEFDQLIKANANKIKRILFPNEIPEDLNYSVY